MKKLSSAAARVRSSRMSRTLLVASLLSALPLLHAAVNLPVEVHSYNSAPTSVVTTVTTNGTATALLLEVHNLRYNNQMSVTVSGASINITNYNPVVHISEVDRSVGGIGGAHATITCTVDLPSSLPAGAHTVEFFFKGSNGVVSGYRVLGFALLGSNGASVTPASNFVDVVPGAPPAGYNTTAARDAGEIAFKASNTLRESVLTNRTIKASCADCHFDDGGDLYYFKFSNESIVARSRFHGLSNDIANKIAAYIRMRTGPSPGTPWDPPFQPGPGTDASAPENWAAGRGLNQVVTDPQATMRAIFGRTTVDNSPITFTEVAKTIDHTGNFSVRNVPIEIQLPDWNSWLPPVSPKDIWPGTYGTNFIGSAADQAYTTLENALDTSTEVNAALANGDVRVIVTRFQRDVNNWLRTTSPIDAEDTWRVYSSTVLNNRDPRYSTEEAKYSLTRWVATKMFEVIQREGLYTRTVDDAADADPKYRGEVLGWPGDMQNLFFVAPHYTADQTSHPTGQNINYAWQEPGLGILMSHQWYMTQMTLNAGMRQRGPMNAPIDWDYQINHTTDAGTYTNRWSGMRQLLNRIKLFEARDNGNGLATLQQLPLIDKDGFSQRVLHPWTFFSTNNGRTHSFKGSFDAVQPDLWRKVFEEFLYEYLDVLESLSISDSSRMPRQLDEHRLPPSSTVVTAYGGSGNIFVTPNQNHATNTFRLLPLAEAQGVDKLTLLDYALWAKKVWPASGSSNNFAGQVNLADLLFYENFEGSSPALFTEYSPVAIKPNTTTWQNNPPAGTPRNGGAAFVAKRFVAANATRNNVHFLTKALGGATTLRLRARVAFTGPTALSPQFKMGVGFDGGTATFAPTLALNTTLMTTKFVTYEETIMVPAGKTNLTRIDINWYNPNSSQGTVYIDNVEVLDVSVPTDTTPPPVPTGLTVTPNAQYVNVNWSDVTASDLAGYNVYRQVAAEGASSRQKLTPSVLGASVLNDYATLSGVDYRYDVTAVDRSGNESAPSSLSSAVGYDGLANAIWPVPFVRATQEATPGATAVKWFASPTWDVASYKLQRKTSAQSTYTDVGTFTRFIYLDSGLTSGVTYNYRVVAIGNDGTASAPSMVATVQAP